MKDTIRKQSIFEMALGINKPEVRVSRNGKLLIDKNGYVRSNYNNPEVRAKLEKQMSAQARMGESILSYEES